MGTSEAKIQALEEIIEDDGGITAGRFDTIIASWSFSVDWTMTTHPLGSIDALAVG